MKVKGMLFTCLQETEEKYCCNMDALRLSTCVCAEREKEKCLSICRLCIINVVTGHCNSYKFFIVVINRMEVCSHNNRFDEQKSHKPHVFFSHHVLQPPVLHQKASAERKKTHTFSFQFGKSERVSEWVRERERVSER